MTTFRKTTLSNDQIYHVYNRGVERRPVFTNKWEFKRGIDTLWYYRFSDLPFRLSRFLNLPESERKQVLDNLNKGGQKLVEFIAYCLMPNHFHFLLKQLKDNGISTFLSNFTNSYTKYFNTKQNRIGPLFEGVFKAVLVETDEQLVHLSRYIHLNPVTSYIVKTKDLEQYLWSSLPEYLNTSPEPICQKGHILSFFPSAQEYRKFLLDQISYAQQIDKMKHLLIE